MLFKSQLYIKCLCYTNSVSMLFFVTKSYFLLLHNILLYEQSKFCLSILLLKGLQVVISCGYYGYTWPSLLVSMSTRLSWGCVQQWNWYDMKCVCVCAYMLSCVQPFVTPWTGACLSGFSVHGIFQARILECVDLSYFKGSSTPRDQNCVSCNGRWILHHCATWAE